MKKSFNELITAAAKDDVATITKIHEGRIVNLSDCGTETKRTPLHWAALNGSAKAASYLVGHLPKESINQLDAKGNTALNLCTQHTTKLLPRLATISVLLESGADPFLPNQEGSTALKGMVGFMAGNEDSKPASANPEAQQQIGLIIGKMKALAIARAREKNQSLHITAGGEVRFIDISTPLSATFMKNAIPLRERRPSSDLKDTKVQRITTTVAPVSNVINSV